MTTTPPAARTAASPNTARWRRSPAGITWLLTFGVRTGERFLWWTQLVQLGIAAAATGAVFVLAGGRWGGLWPFDPVNTRPLIAAAIMLFGGAVIAYFVELEARLTERRRVSRAGDRATDGQGQMTGAPTAMTDHERQIVVAALARHRAMPINTIVEDDVLETRCAELLYALDGDTATGVDPLVLAEYVRRYARPQPGLPQLATAD
jgi:hypothetical protein